MNLPDAVFEVNDFTLDSGVVMPRVRIAYVTRGTLDADGGNAVLLTHGYTSTHRFVLDADGGASEGSWGSLVGPGKAIDTDRYFVISSNTLGSSWGSTGPASHNPATGAPYGPEFPEISLADIVRLQRMLLDSLKVSGLVAVIGPSMGGFQAFQWAVQYPDFMKGIVPVLTAPYGRNRWNRAAATTAMDKCRADPNWNDGWVYENGGIPQTLAAIRLATLQQYGMEQYLRDTVETEDERSRILWNMAQGWASSFDPNALGVLRDAINRFDVSSRLDAIRAKVLYVLSSTDRLFPPQLEQDVMPALRQAGVDAEYHLLDSEYGHLASGLDWQKWDGRLRQFLAALEQR